MRRLGILLALVLSACVPTFTDAEPRELALRYDGLTLTLTSDRPVQRGSVGLRAASVVSPYCGPCTPDADGVTLLRLLEGGDYRAALTEEGLELGEVRGLARAKSVIVRLDERRAVVRYWPDKPPGKPSP